jgi:hypothetical protein
MHAGIRNWEDSLMLRSDSLQRRLKARLRVEQLEARNLLSVSANAVVNNTAEDPSGTGANFTQSETATAVANDGSVITVFNDSEENLVAGGHFTGFSRSTNGGGSFTDGDVLPNTTAGDAGDPVLAVNKSNGNIYFSTLPLNVSNKIQIYRSTNNGQSFSFLANAAPGFSASAFLDKDWMTVDNNSGTGQNNIYVSYGDFAFGAVDQGIFLSRSTNGGTTWSKIKVTPTADNNAVGSNVEVGSDHAVYVAYVNQTTSPEQIKIRKSTSRGTSFGPVHIVANLKTTGGSQNACGLDFRTNAFPMMVTDPANSQNLYIVYNDAGQNAGDRCDIYFTQSNNGGTTWTTPVVLNSDSATGGTADQWQPSIAITPDGTHLFVGWYDRRLSGPGNGNINREGVIGTISGSTVTFGGNFRIDDATTNGSPGFPEVFGTDAVVNSTYMGDYDQAAASADNTKFYDSWGDNRLGTAPDVFFASIDTNTGTSVTSLVVHGTDFQKLGDGPIGVSAVIGGGSHTQPELARFVSPSVIPGGGGSTTAAAKKAIDATTLEQVFAANVLIGSGQFQGNHHASQGQDDGALWHFGDL